MDLKRIIFNGVAGVLYGILSWGVFALWTDTKHNTEDNIKQSTTLETIENRIDKLENSQSNLPEIYVTRRELNIILSNIESKVDSTNSEVKIMNGKFDKLMEKIYEKK